MKLLLINQILRCMAILCLIGCIDSRLVKRSYSDQSVRGYLTEVKCIKIRMFELSQTKKFVVVVCVWNMYWRVCWCSAFAGGTKYAKRNFSSCSDVNARYIHIVDRLDATTTHIALWRIRATFGHSQHGTGLLDCHTPIVSKYQLYRHKHITIYPRYTLQI